MVRNLSDKLEATFPATIHSYSTVGIVRHDDVFSEFFKLEESSVAGQSLEKRKKAGEKKCKKRKPKDVRHLKI